MSCMTDAFDYELSIDPTERDTPRIYEKGADGTWLRWTGELPDISSYTRTGYNLEFMYPELQPHYTLEALYEFAPDSDLLTVQEGPTTNNSNKTTLTQAFKLKE